VASQLDSAAELERVGTELGLDLSARQREQLLAYVALLARWNATYNLTAIRDAGSMLSHHLADCLAIVAPLNKAEGAEPGGRVLDVGSGAGLPGCIIAIMRPDLAVTCIDRVGKKVAFIRHAAGQLELKNVVGEHKRVEDLGTTHDLVVSRAFADLSEFLSLTRHVVAPRGRWVAMKGRITSDELERVPDWADAFHVEQLLVPGLGAERCLVWVRRRVTDERSPTMAGEH
jgi:16S rRNA (guanine527-N7)-methyltransferase